MAGIMVSASTGVMNSLLGKLATIMGEGFAKLKNLRKEVKFISDELGSMKDALERLADVDELDLQTKRWRNTLREISYDIEDIIDDFMQKIGEKEHTSWFGRKTIRRLKTLIFRHRLAEQIEDIKKLVCETNDRRRRYDLDSIVPPSGNDVAIDPRVVTLYENTASLIGVEGPVDELVDWLKDGEKQLKVVSIVGFGGLGKTTLANLVYGRIKREFSYRAFVPVSQKPDIPKLLLGLLSQLGITPHHQECGLNNLLDILRERLQNERYLIIIDDLWDVSTWDIIKCAFPENDLGSKVIVTTRIQEVSAACCRNHHRHILQMKPLSNEDSRKLFFGRIFGSEEACPYQLRDVSVEILKRCGGLPLAITCIASMLATEGFNQKERWEHVRDSLGSATNLTLERVRRILNLSYKDLPPHLKTCFLYLGMYPEDYKIDRSNLERQWMAEGFISKGNGRDVERVARSYFNELVNRSLIQPVDIDNIGAVTACRVHDMMLDLILIKSAQENFLTIVDDPQIFTALEYKARRLSIRLGYESNCCTILPRNISLSQVRSAMFFGNSLYTPPLSEFKFLRVLFFDSHNSANIDLTGLCKLYQLRYLWFGCPRSHQFLKEIKMLQHLETFCVLEYNILPSDLVTLQRLKYLVVDTMLPDGIGNMKSLQHLSGFDIAREKLENITGLGELTHLRYLSLGCSAASNDRERRMDALCTSLGTLFSLEDLHVDLMGCIDGLWPSSPIPTPYRLERLMVSRNSHFSKVPRWIGELQNLSELECQVSELLSDGTGILAELPVLTDLDLNIQVAPSEMIVIYGKAFPALRRFKFQKESAPYLTFQPGAMPKLQMFKLMSWASGSEQNGVAPAGLEHLLALEEFSVCIHGVKESDKTSIKSAFRSAVDMHPGNPRFVFSS